MARLICPLTVVRLRGNINRPLQQVSRVLFSFHLLS